MIGKTVCHMHGGRSLAGVAHPNHRHGRYSKRLPERLGEQYEEAVHDRDLLTLRDEIGVVTVRIGEILERDPDPDDWREIEGLVETRRRLVDSERKRLVDMQQMITSEQAMTLVAAVVDAVKRHVSDRETLQAISTEVSQLTERDTA